MPRPATQRSDPPTISAWVDTAPGDPYPPLDGALGVDVAVVGAGITGITAALLLKRAGCTVALVEAGRVARGTSGHTTAKVTSGHGLIYSDLERRVGPSGARTYAEANDAAARRVAELVEAHGIDCDYELRENFVYAEAGDDPAELKAEAQAAKRAGLPASFVTEGEVPFPIAGAVRLTGQAQFHPRKYLLALAASIPGDGSHVFEGTRALGVGEDGPCRVRTDRGPVDAGHVIVATLMPFPRRGLLFAKAFPRRHQALVADAPPERIPRGMWVSTGSSPHSLRSVRLDGTDAVLVLGEGDEVGEHEDTDERYRRLEAWARARLGITRVRYRWSAHDYYSADRVPYVGRLSHLHDNVFAATGFGGWGMTGGTLAAMLLTDRILERENPWTDLFDAHRIEPVASAPRLVAGNARVGRHLIGDRVTKWGRDVESLARGEGAIVRAGLHRVAAYRDDDGRVRAVSPTCTHMGCMVAWNPGDRTWDCPCHGSRFDVDGKLLAGPATRDLPSRDVDGARGDRGSAMR